MTFQGKLDRELDGKTIGIGGSVTIDQLGVFERLKAHNDVKWHQHAADPNAERIAACHTQVYLTSVNAIAETGELINIDGTGNRVAQTLYGHERVIFVEVKTRTSDLHFDPMQAITKAKIRNLVNAANGYISYYNLPMYVQYDVMILIGNPPDFDIRFFPNAFQPPLRTFR